MPVEVMIIDDDDRVRRLLAEQVEHCGYSVCAVGSGSEALELYADVEPTLVLLDYRMEGMNGLETLARLKKKAPDCRVVMMSSYDDAGVIVQAMKLGAENYLTQPVPLAELRVLLDTIGTGSGGEEEVLGLEGVIGRSEVIQRVFRMVRRVADTWATVLIRGESGTGKEVIARAVHLLSPSSNRPFITLDCTNIPANLMESELFGHERGAFTDARTQKIGLLETANGGTLFLDEIGLMPQGLQAKLLNVLETQRFRRVGGNEEIEVKVRILAATNEDLERAVREGNFREDLYYRLNVVPVDIPPLREREDDVLLIADHYLQWYTSLHGQPARQLADDAKALFKVYPWPGNVRELKNVIERAVLMTDQRVIPARALTIDRRTTHPTGVLRIDREGGVAVQFPPGGVDLEKIERELIKSALAQTGGNVSKAAGLLHLSRDTLRYRIAKFRLDE